MSLTGSARLAIGIRDSMARSTEEISVLVKTIEEKTCRQGHLAVKVEKPKPVAGSTLLVHMELASKLSWPLSHPGIRMGREPTAHS